MLDLNQLYLGSCLDILPLLDSEGIDLIYMDPPFYTQRKHKLSSSSGEEYSFDDRWDSIDDYLSFIRKVLIECRRVLSNKGTIFLHCDRTASHHLRCLLDEVFGASYFQSEIIWSYRRWSNARKGLLNAHQVIFFYSKTSDFQFNPIYTDYSPTTNVDQILQDRQRAANGKSTYKRDEKGNVVLGGEKKGVPLSDVWDMPYLNPKAKERTGYPTQKPLSLLKRILSLCTSDGDVVLDPFSGSGTTCVAAKLLNRKYIGIDNSEQAIELGKKRLSNPIESESILLKQGLSSFENKYTEELSILASVGAIPVQRNKGIDGYLRTHINGAPVPVRIQKETETLEDAISELIRATQKMNFSTRIVIQTSHRRSLLPMDSDVIVIPSLSLSLHTQLDT